VHEMALAARKRVSWFLMERETDMVHEEKCLLPQGKFKSYFCNVHFSN
jgi:hypothetical protein